MKYLAIERYIGIEGLSIKEFSEKCDISPSTMSKFLHGKSDIKKSNIDKILKVVGLSYEECFKEQKDEEL